MHRPGSMIIAITAEISAGMVGNVTREFLSGVSRASRLVYPIYHRRWSLIRENSSFSPQDTLPDAAAGTLGEGRPFIAGFQEGLKTGRRGDYP